MASLTRAEARTLVRYLVGDDGTNAACTDAQINSYLEEARQWYAASFPEEFVAQAKVVTITSVLSETTFATTTYLFRSLDFAFDATSGAAMDKMDVVLIDQKLKRNAVTGEDSAPMRSWGCRRINDTDWALFTYPQNTALDPRSIAIYGHYELEPLTSDAAVLLGQHSSRVVARLAALEVARAAGRDPDFIASLAAQLPERVATRRQDVKLVLDAQPMRT